MQLEAAEKHDKPILQAEQYPPPRTLHLTEINQKEIDQKLITKSYTICC